MSRTRSLSLTSPSASLSLSSEDVSESEVSTFSSDPTFRMTKPLPTADEPSLVSAPVSFRPGMAILAVTCG
jgi:hypothetical protein